MLTRDDNSFFRERMSFSFDVKAAVAATATLGICTPDPNRLFRIERVEILVEAAYAADPANFYAMTLSHGAGPTTAASWSTQTSAQGALAANATQAMVLSGTDANLVVPAGALLKLVLTKNGAAANIQPRVVIHGRYVN